MAEPTFEQLTGQVRELTQRVAALERELGLRRALPELEQTDVAPAGPVRKSEPAESPQREANRLEANIGLRLVNRVGAITLILGFAFFFRFAVDKNWIGETGRVLLGIACGLLLISGGEFAFRRGQRTFARGITGAGAAAIYLSLYAAFAAYRLVGMPVAFTALGLLTAAAGLLALRYAAHAIALLALFGGFLAPVLLEERPGTLWFEPAYAALLAAAFLELARRLGSTSLNSSLGSRLIAWAALAGTGLLSLRFQASALTLFLPVYYGIFALQPNRWLFTASQFLFVVRAGFLPPNSASFVPDLLGMSALGAAVVRWRKWAATLPFLIAAAASSWAVAQASLPLAGALVTLTVLFLLFLVSSLWIDTPQGWAVTTGELLSLPAAAAFFFLGCYSRLQAYPGCAALLALALAGLYCAVALWLRRSGKRDAESSVAGGTSMAFVTLAAPIYLHAFRITAAWALEGAALVFAARRSRDASLRLSLAHIFGLLVLLSSVLQFAAAELTSNSVSGQSLVWNARFVTALVLAIALFLAALWSRGTRVPPALPAITGHAVLLAATGLEISGWALRHHASDYDNVVNAALSIFFAAYALALVAFGTGTRTKENRFLGLALIALVVAKLYLIDVWRLDTVYRFVAFAALGAMLLAVSFLYSRYKDRIASWLQPNMAPVTPPAASETHPPPRPE